jgi:hypothetical protein
MLPFILVISDFPFTNQALISGETSGLRPQRLHYYASNGLIWSKMLNYTSHLNLRKPLFVLLLLHPNSPAQ